jgi:predicted AAA+ superfamily ATPase
MKSLLRAGKELGCKNLRIITWDYESEDEGIHYIPLWKWLLYENPTNAAID